MVDWVVKLKEEKEQQGKISELESSNRALVENLLTLEFPKRCQEVSEEIDACVETHNALYHKNPRKKVEISLLQGSKDWFRIIANPHGSNIVFVEVLFDLPDRAITFTSPTLGENANGDLLIDLATDNTVKIFLRNVGVITPKNSARLILQPILSVL